MPKQYPAPFLEILKKTFHWEGGLGNDKADHGGLTNMGVTRFALEDYYKRPVTDAEIEQLDRATAIDVYYVVFWQGARIATVPSFLRLEIFNSYTGSQKLGLHAVKCLQRLVGFTGRDIDGDIGPKTQARFREVETWDPARQHRLNNALVIEILRELIQICRRDPVIQPLLEHTQLKFLLGWFNRYSEFIDTLGDPTSAPIA